MDAAHNVGLTVTPAPSAEYVRDQIHHTLDTLRSHIQQLHDYSQSRLGGLNNPLHLRDTITQRPYAACTMALGLGMLCGALRLHRAPIKLASRTASLSGRVAVGFGGALGSHLLNQLVHRITPTYE
jgi:hypothetical protein